MCKLDNNKINELAHIFTTKTFKGLEETTLYVFSDELMDIQPNKITDKFFELGMKVDNYYYEWLHYCLLEYVEKLNEYIDSEIDEIPFDDIEDAILEEIEPDIYNCDLLHWLSSNLTRAYYVEDAMNECKFDSFWSLLQWAQIDEMREVYQIGFEFVGWYLNDYTEE